MKKLLLILIFLINLILPSFAIVDAEDKVKISLEEAMAVQNKVTIEESSIIPFIKAIGSTYVVQIGSFSEQEKANALAEKMKNKGYSVKVISEN